jgi:quinol monooxygenase YgiN
MFIVHLYLQVAAGERRVALDALLERLDAVRAMPGCLRYIPFEDPSDDQMIGILEEWESREAFAAYTASDRFSDLNRTLRPLMLAPPISRRFRATLIDEAD